MMSQLRIKPKSIRRAVTTKRIKRMPMIGSIVHVLSGIVFGLDGFEVMCSIVM
jgi:hypothetical protein